METQWIFSPIDAQQEVLQQQIATELGVSPVIAKILVQRGITTFEEARLFFRPDLSQLHDPFLMKDMDKAVDRLNLALAKKEGILAGYSTGGNVAAALRIAAKVPQGQAVATIACDSGTRYLSSGLFSEK